MSDQTQKPRGALPKGYDANTPSMENTPSTKVVKQKKINFRSLIGYTPTDQDQRGKELQEYETSYLARLEKEIKIKPEESSTAKVEYDDELSTKFDVNLGRLNLAKHVTTKRDELQAERKEYEKKFLARYKVPKVKLGKLSSLYKPVAKIRVDRNKVRKEYERKFLTRYKVPKVKLGKLSSLYKPEPPRIKVDRNKVRKEYEQKFLARYKVPKANLR